MGLNVLLDTTVAESTKISGMGIVIVFAVLILLYFVVKLLSKSKAQSNEAAVSASAAPASAPAVPAEPRYAPGSCGEVATFSVPDRTAAMIMALTAEELNVPLNEIRFISIKEAE